MEILQLLHDSEINGSIEWCLDGIWTVKIGDPLNGCKANAIVKSAEEAEAWLHIMARALYPDSDYARKTDAAGYVSLAGEIAVPGAWPI